MSISAFAGIPVIDGVQISEHRMAQIEKMAKWVEQHAQMAMQIANQVEQIEQLKRELESMTGSRALGRIMNDPALKNYLPDGWEDAYNAVKDGGYGGLSGTAEAIYDANRIFDSCAFINDDEERLVCEARAVKPSQDKGFALDAYDMAIDRISQIEDLMGEINNTTDPKSIAELQARIGAEQANIQNEQAKLQLYMMVTEADKELQLQRKREIQAAIWAREGGTEIAPLSFD